MRELYIENYLHLLKAAFDTNRKNPNKYREMIKEHSEWKRKKGILHMQ